MISLSDIKALWVSEINLDNNNFKRFARIFAINLYKTLLRLMGLYSETFLGLNFWNQGNESVVKVGRDSTCI